ncbi:hypothetical protein PP353_gp22 [Arthrobacter phage Kumotta]|uniref:Uncharacterized protein n=2 Tax=Kumottavirus TaxID=3044749 RepID=A0A4Y6EM29_9CAUD|nr:hypothetical protein PP353_gp22 [Arthrobacter phage Kumotta]YP_010649504.1 hypothetical protein PP356_gp22 [Arthrobacter phage MargaretKali]AXH44402.1 hypothetical protein SEA_MARGARETKALI_22 [Arthrobacter phage MargaretKali]QDF19532.1 hypothetical protein SEA_KUMOTTA_22 [Arthrobacter phage Kumotta]
MTELYFALAPEPEPMYAGMPLPLLLGIIGGLITLAAALVAAFSKKWRTPADDREDKKIGIEADERLLKRFEDMLQERDDEIAELRAEVKEIAGKVQDLIEERGSLIDWIYAAIRIVRDLDGIHLLPAPPKGVTIADHPSARRADATTGGTA